MFANAMYLHIKVNEEETIFEEMLQSASSSWNSTYRYCPPESHKYISSSFMLRAVAASGLGKTK